MIKFQKVIHKFRTPDAHQTTVSWKQPNITPTATPPQTPPQGRALRKQNICLFLTPCLEAGLGVVWLLGLNEVIILRKIKHFNLRYNLSKRRIHLCGSGVLRLLNLTFVFNQLNQYNQWKSVVQTSWISVNQWFRQIWSLIYWILCKPGMTND